MSHSKGPATLQDLKTFGLTLAGACLVWAGILWWKDKPTASLWLLALSPVLAVLGLLAPATLGPLHRVWMPAARAVAHAVTFLILAVAFYVVFTPYGWVMRLVGRDPLERKLEPQRNSYWIQREKRPFDPKALTRQY